MCLYAWAFACAILHIQSSENSPTSPGDQIHIIILGSKQLYPTDHLPAPNFKIYIYLMCECEYMYIYVCHDILVKIRGWLLGAGLFLHNMSPGDWTCGCLLSSLLTLLPPQSNLLYYCCLFTVLETEPRTVGMLGKLSALIHLNGPPQFWARLSYCTWTSLIQLNT